MSVCPGRGAGEGEGKGEGEGEGDFDREKRLRRWPFGREGWLRSICDVQAVTRNNWGSNSPAAGPRPAQSGKALRRSAGKGSWYARYLDRRRSV